MKICTPTTVFSNHTNQQFVTRTPSPFSDCSPKRANSSELKVKHSHQFGRVLQMFKNEKRCVSVHRLGIKSPILSSPKMSVVASRNTIGIEELELREKVQINEKAYQKEKIGLASASTTGGEIQENAEFKKWIRGKSGKNMEQQNAILERLNGSRRKVKISVKAFKLKDYCATNK